MSGGLGDASSGAHGSAKARGRDPNGAHAVATTPAVIARAGPVKDPKGRSLALRPLEPEPAQPPLSTYSRIVRTLRVALPIAAIAVVVAVFYSGRAPQGATELAFRTGQFAALQSGLRLTNPRFTGATSAGEPFLIRADWAEPDGPDPKIIELNAISGSISTADGRELALTATEGTLRPKEQTVELTGGVSIETSDGYAFTTDTLHADAENRILESAGPIEGVGPLGELSAGLFRVEDGADGVIWFENGVTATLRRMVE